MDYTQILEAMRTASLFDLFRLRAAIDQELDNPARIEKVRAQLRPGMTISYFNENENRLIKATIDELHRTRLLVVNIEDKKLWSIRFGSVNLEGVPVDLHPVSSQQPLDRTLLKVGELVGFRDKQNREMYGIVRDLNQKSAAIITNSGERWRVAYQLLFKVLDQAGGDALVVEFSRE